MSNDLIAKTAIDRRLAEILIPVIEDMGSNWSAPASARAARPRRCKSWPTAPMAASMSMIAREISTMVSATLDVEDPIEDKCNLEVSFSIMTIPDAPERISRPLLKSYDVSATSITIDGRKRFTGTLAGVEGERS